ncbi:MAG: hypothetical protein P8N76_17815 [Pirellulaceae bacterium]|nr:hypothetical protein [Pirellulaceae bacterium]
MSEAESETSTESARQAGLKSLLSIVLPPFASGKQINLISNEIQRAKVLETRRKRVVW